jgi:hypothetical protein
MLVYAHELLLTANNGSISFFLLPFAFQDRRRLAVSCFTAFMAIQHGNC